MNIIFKNIVVSLSGAVLMAEAVAMVQTLSNSRARRKARIKSPCWPAAENIWGSDSTRKLISWLNRWRKPKPSRGLELFSKNVNSSTPNSAKPDIETWLP